MNPIVLCGFLFVLAALGGIAKILRDISQTLKRIEELTTAQK